MGSPLNVTLNGGGNHSEDVTELGKYTEYEFQVLAFTSVGDGPKSSLVVERTKEDGKNLPTDIMISNPIPLIVVESTKMFLCFNAQKFKDV